VQSLKVLDGGRISSHHGAQPGIAQAPWRPLPAQQGKRHSSSITLPHQQLPGHCLCWPIILEIELCSTYRAADMKDRVARTRNRTAMVALRFRSVRARSQRGRSTLAANGYNKDHPAEKYYRDSKPAPLAKAQAKLEAGNCAALLK
jgi:hypothetical protein